MSFVATVDMRESHKALPPVAVMTMAPPISVQTQGSAPRTSHVQIGFSTGSREQEQRHVECLQVGNRARQEDVGDRDLEDAQVPSWPTPPPMPAEAAKGTAVRRRALKYRVKQGDTLFSIAKLYRTTIASLKDRNRLRTNSIQVGQRLTIVTERTTTATN